MNETGSSTYRSLPGHAAPVTAPCEALGTMYPPMFSEGQPVREGRICQHRGGEGLGTSDDDPHM